MLLDLLRNPSHKILRSGLQKKITDVLTTATSYGVKYTNRLVAQFIGQGLSACKVIPSVVHCDLNVLRIYFAGLLTHMEHMRMDPKHQFAAQYVLSRAAAERRERENFLAAVTATNSMGGPASPHSVHSDTSSSNNGEVDGPGEGGSTGSVHGSTSNNSVAAAVAAVAAAAAAGGNVVVPTGGRLSVSPADNQTPLVLHHNNNNTTTNNNNNNNNNNPAAVKLAELMAARTGGMSEYNLFTPLRQPRTVFVVYLVNFKLFPNYNSGHTTIRFMFIINSRR